MSKYAMYARRGGVRAQSFAPVSTLLFMDDHAWEDGIGLFGSRVGVACKILSDADQVLDGVEIGCLKSGVGAGNCWVELWSDAPDLPGQLLMRSFSRPVSSMTGALEWQRFQVPSVQLLSGVNYWLAVRSDGDPGPNCLVVGLEILAAGTFETNDGATWSLLNANQTIPFKAYGQPS